MDRGNHRRYPARDPPRREPPRPEPDWDDPTISVTTAEARRSIAHEAERAEARKNPRRNP